MSNSTSNLASMLVHAAQHFGDRPALIQGDKVWTWAELNERVGRAAQVPLRLEEGEKALADLRRRAHAVSLGGASAGPRP